MSQRTRQRLPLVADNVDARPLLRNARAPCSPKMWGGVARKGGYAQNVGDQLSVIMATVDRHPGYDIEKLRASLCELWGTSRKDIQGLP